MKRTALQVALALSTLTLAACVGGDITGGDDSSDRAESELSAIPKFNDRRLCEKSTTPGMMSCNARIRVNAAGGIQPLASPQGLSPADLQSAYKLNTAGGAGATIAIVDAQDAPTAEADLAVYRTKYGLPACTTANGCFKKVNQNGVAGSYPAADQGWAGEIALDLDMASAVCPNCKILLVEANSATQNNLGTALNTAVKLGATVVSNSYGGGESTSDPQTDAAYFNHPGVGIFVSSGDDGYGAEYPASSPYVIAVGGTSLTKSTSASRGWVEGAWNGAGSGCSARETKPSWQKDTGCTKRTVADVSAVADPNTGVAVYDSYGSGGWVIVGGTSAASPIVAGIFALTGHGSADASLAYSNPTAFFDVATGSNGSCSGSYLCTSKAGYDGPTGIGTPNGAVLGGTTGGGGGGGGGTPDMGTGGGGGGTPDMSPGGGGGGGTTCSHAICSTGTKLVSGCDPCATKICAADSFCCNNSWDATCVGEVKTVCGLTTCGGGTGGGGGGTTCSHAICSTGTKLVTGCDPCATKVCAADSYCCNNKWDSVCVSEVGSVCGQTCQ